jgi:hypothetical protein
VREMSTNRLTSTLRPCDTGFQPVPTTRTVEYRPCAGAPPVLESSARVENPCHRRADFPIRQHTGVRRRGYVLVMTLGLLVLASTLLVTIGRMATSRVLLARLEQQDLQRRWGEISCRNAILPYASQILARQEAAQHRPVPIYRENLQLEGGTFSLILGDEQAKANVNAILQRSDKSSTEIQIRAVLSGSGLGNTVFLRPQPIVRDNLSQQPASSAQLPQFPRWISGYGQIFTGVGPDRILAVAAPVLTCWGNSAVNVMRASEASLRLAAGSSMSSLEVSRLLEARNAAFAPIQGPAHTPAVGAPSPNLDAVSRLLAQARIDPKVRVSVAFTSTSTCYSLWIVSQGRQRARYRLYVSDESNPQFTRIEAFVW